MSMLDTLFNIFKTSNPEASDEDIKSHIESLKASPDQIGNALAPLTPKGNDNAPAPAVDLSSIPPMSPLSFPSANDTKSSFDVHTSDNTVTQDGKPESLPIKAPATSPLIETPPIPSAEPIAPPAPSPVAQAKQAASAPAKLDNSNELSAAMSVAPKSDADAELAAREKRKHDLGIIPVAGAGIGDAISSAASAFGARGNTGAQEKVKEDIDNSITKDKAAFDQKQKKDPNSDISQHYQKVLGLMLGDKAKGFNIGSMSAESIATTLPEVEKYMQKELGMAQIKANKELMLGERQSQFEDRQVNQGMGRIASVRGDASLARSELQRDAAITATNRINEVHNAGKELNPIDYTDILGQLYKARSGQAPDQEIMKKIRQPLASSDFNHAWTYLTGQQAPATTRDVSNSLLDIASSMGKQADTFHDAYMAPHLVKPAGVSDEKWAPIIKVGRGLSFADATKQASQPSAQTPKASSAEGTTKKIGNRNFTVINGVWHEIQ